MPLDHELVVLHPLCAEMLCEMWMPVELLNAKPLRLFPSAMQLMYSKCPFEVVVPSPVQPFEKPLSHDFVTRPTKRTYVATSEPPPVVRPLTTPPPAPPAPPAPLSPPAP